MSEPKERGPAVSYLVLFPALQQAAEAHGYSLALHGSLKRDMDLVAIAWRIGASDPDVLVEAIATAVPGLLRVEGDPCLMPHGRLGYVLHFDDPQLEAHRYIDLSVIAPLRRREVLVNA
ncbi:MAG TPA: hypothetical protein VJN95_08805 [Gemmatimonadales bacterium]|nr:hypothetical protein [Gemmatimonadales bacterium]